MPYAKRKPGAGPVRPVRHPDDEFGFSWEPDAVDQLWDAHEALQQRNDARPLVRALLQRGLLPRPVRVAFWLWLGDPLPPHPPELSPKDRAMLEAVVAYERTPFKRTKYGRAEKREQRATRVLDTQPPEQPGRWREQGVTEELLLRVAGGKGGRQGMLISNYRDYHDLISFFPDAEPPKRTKNRPPVLTTAPPRR
jgi:hypothetical protein